MTPHPTPFPHDFGHVTMNGLKAWQQEKDGLWSKPYSVSICVILGKPFNLSVPQFPHLYIGAVLIILTSDEWIHVTSAE